MLLERSLTIPVTNDLRQFFPGNRTFHAFSEMLGLKCLWHVAAAILSVSIPLCCAFLGFCSGVFYCQKAQTQSTKLLIIMNFP